MQHLDRVVLVQYFDNVLLLSTKQPMLAVHQSKTLRVRLVTPQMVCHMPSTCLPIHWMCVPSSGYNFGLTTHAPCPRLSASCTLPARSRAGFDSRPFIEGVTTRQHSHAFRGGSFRPAAAANGFAEAMMVAFWPWPIAPTPQARSLCSADTAQCKNLSIVRLRRSDMGYWMWQVPAWVQSQ